MESPRQILLKVTSEDVKCVNHFKHDRYGLTRFELAQIEVDECRLLVASFFWVRCVEIVVINVHLALVISLLDS